MGKPLKEIQQHKKDKKLDSKGLIFERKVVARQTHH